MMRVLVDEVGEDERETVGWCHGNNSPGKSTDASLSAARSSAGDIVSNMFDIASKEINSGRRGLTD